MGKNTSSKDKVEWGRRPPFIGAPESNRYVFSPRTSSTTAQVVEHGERSKTEGEAEPYERHYRWSQRYYRWPQRYCRLAQRYYRWDRAQRLPRAQGEGTGRRAIERH